MITLNKNSLKYKDSDGNMRDSGVLFASDGENDYATKEELDRISEEKVNVNFNNVPQNSIPFSKNEGVASYDASGEQLKESVNIINIANLLDGIIVANGTVTSTPLTKHTDFIDVEPSDVLRIVNWAPEGQDSTPYQYPGGAYNANGSFVARLTLWKMSSESVNVDGVDTTAYMYTIPDGVYKIKLNIGVDYVNTAMATINKPIPSKYIPYSEAVESVSAKVYDIDEDVIRIRRSVQVPFTGFCKISYSQLWAYAPINTVPAYETAGFLEFDAIKGDVRISADGKIIMCHDNGFTLDNSGKITTYSASNCTLIRDMQSTDILNLEHSSYNMGVHPCTLDDYLMVCAKWNKIPFVTLRDEYIDEIVPLVLEALKRWNLRHKAIINSFTVSTLEKVRKLDRYVWVNQVAMNALNKTMVTDAKRLFPCMLSPYMADGTTETLQLFYDSMADLVEECKMSGIPVLTAVGYTREQCDFYERHYNGAQIQYITDFVPKKKYFICVKRENGAWKFVKKYSFEQTGEVSEANGEIRIKCNQIVSTWLRYLYPSIKAVCVTNGSITATTSITADGSYIVVKPSTIEDGMELLTIVDF